MVSEAGKQNGFIYYQPNEVTDKKTIQLIEGIAEKVAKLTVDNATNSLKINAVIWILGAILMVLLPAFGFLIAFWVQNAK